MLGGSSMSSGDSKIERYIAAVKARDVACQKFLALIQTLEGMVGALHDARKHMDPNSPELHRFSDPHGVLNLPNWPSAEDVRRAWQMLFSTTTRCLQAWSEIVPEDRHYIIPPRQECR